MTTTPGGPDREQGERGPDARHRQSQHLWAPRPRGPVSDGRDDGIVGSEAAQQQTVCDSGTSEPTWAPVVTGPGVSS